MSHAARPAPDGAGSEGVPLVWRVAPDGGRPTGRACVHAEAVALPTGEEPRACRECVERGWDWVRLRWCASCGHVGCCDSSRGGHAYAHHAATEHPVVVSLARDEDWAWCFPDEVFLVRATGPEAAAAGHGVEGGPAAGDAQ